MPFEAMPQGMPSSVVATKEFQLSQAQRRAIIVKALDSGFNPPLSFLIRGIEDNHAVGGTDTTMLWYSRRDGIRMPFEARLSELYGIREARIAASKGHGGRQRRFRGF